MLLGPRQGETLSMHWRGGEKVSRLDLDANPPKLYLAKQIQRRKWEHGCDDPAACVKALRKCRTKPCHRRWEHGCDDPATCKGRPHFCPQRRALPGCSHHTRPCPPLCPPNCTGHARWCPQRTGGGLQEVDLKTDESVRDLILPAALVEMLIAHRERQQRERDDRGLKWDPDGLVFAGPEGQPIDPRRDHARWEQLLIRAGVPDSRLHTARHDAGTLALTAGIDIAVVQEVLGHTSIRTTRQYVDIADSLKKEMAERVMNLLFDGSLAALLQPGAATKQPRS
jgi:hypothetical protein